MFYVFFLCYIMHCLRSKFSVHKFKVWLLVSCRQQAVGAKEEIRRFSPKGYEEFCEVERRLRPLFEAAAGLPTAALRWDPWPGPCPPLGGS